MESFRYKDSNFLRQENFDIENEDIDDDLILFWGRGFNIDDIIFLEAELSAWKETHKCDNQAEITLLREICIKILEIRQARDLINGKTKLTFESLCTKKQILENFSSYLDVELAIETNKGITYTKTKPLGLGQKMLTFNVRPGGTEIKNMRLTIPALGQNLEIYNLKARSLTLAEIVARNLVREFSSN